MVEILKTNIHSQRKADQIVERLQERFEGYLINFDLEDCDRILRVEAKKIDVEKLMEELERMGATCQLFEN